DGGPRGPVGPVGAARRASTSLRAWRHGRVRMWPPRLLSGEVNGKTQRAVSRRVPWSRCAHSAPLWLLHPDCIRWIQSRTTTFNPRLDSAVISGMGGAAVARVAAEIPGPADAPSAMAERVAGEGLDPLQRRMRWIF